MMKKVCFVLSAWLVLAFWGCSSIFVKSDYDHDIDFDQYTTFKWMANPKKGSKNSVRKGSLLDKRIRRVVKAWDLGANGRGFNSRLVPLFCFVFSFNELRW